MLKYHHANYYTFLFRSTPDIARIRKLGGVVYHVGRYNATVTAILKSEKQLKSILEDPNLLLVERDSTFALPRPQVKKVFSIKNYQINSQSSLVKANNELLTWNIARVLGGKGRPNNGHGIRVGVIDTGIDFNHPDLKANIKGGVNYVNPSAPPQDDNGHGTHVSGIISAANNKRGIVGLAPAASLYAIKVLDKNGLGTLTTLVKGIEWGLRNKMDILNISISGGQKVPSIIAEVIKTAVNKGILIIAAAGNNGHPKGRGDTVEMPGRMARTMAVAALNRHNQRVSFSATGPSVDIAAPGVDILSTYTGSRYAELSGTSMAAPHVTGAAAILKRLYPKATPAQLKQLLIKHAIDLSPKGVDHLTGAGLVQIR